MCIRDRSRTFRVPANLRNGFFGVRNLTQDTNLVPPVAVNDLMSATFSYSIESTSADYAVGDMIRFYWKPTNTVANAYNTTVFNYTVPASINEGTVDLSPSRVADVLWSDVVTGLTPDVLTATMVIEDGTSNSIAGTSRARVRVEDSVPGNLGYSGSAVAQARVLRDMILATNDLDYFERLVDNELTQDIIRPGLGETVVDPRFAYLDSTGLTTQTLVSSVTRGDDSTADSLTPINLTGITGTTIILQANPAGATPAQIAAAVNSTNMRNGIGFLVGNRLGTKGTAPYTSNTDYTDNL